MRQATLPWAAPPPSILDLTAQSGDSYHQHFQHQPGSPQHQYASLNPAASTSLSPPHQFSIPSLPHALPSQPDQQPIEPQLELDPALFSASQEVAVNGHTVIDVTTPEPITQDAKDAVDAMVSSSSSSRASSSAASSSTVTPAPPQQTDRAQAAVPTAEPLDATLTDATPAAMPGPSIESTTKAQPALHPFFRPGGSNNPPTESNDEFDTEQKRPGRSSRAKGPVSYREDLKAVLRADAAQESARLKEEKRQARLQATAAKKAARSKKAASDEVVDKDAEDFELIETRKAASRPSTSKSAQPESSLPSTSSTSSSEAQQAPRQAESKPLSLAVKGTGAAATANPHPFFTKKPKPQPVPPIEIDDPSSQETQHADGASTQSAGGNRKATASASGSASTPTPASWSLFSTQRISSSKPKKPLNAPWPTQEDTHVAGLTSNESELLTQARSDLAAFHSRRASRTPAAPTPTATHDTPPADFVTQMNRSRPQPACQGISLTGSPDFKSTADFLGQIDMTHLSQLAVSAAAQQAESCRATGQLWNDAFRPHLACGCLGNEGNADYLLDWLQRLLVAAPGSVRTTDGRRKPGVQRRVDRKRKRRPRKGYSDEEDSDDMADFIVDDDEEDAPGEYYDEPIDDVPFGKFGRIERQALTDDESDLRSSQGTTSAVPAQQHCGERHASHYASLDKLSNCMILTGPHGSGKTASVYACAAQLGYEVFELYPGMGRRSGRDLLAAVGDLGRNHMVSSGGVGGGATLKHRAPTLGSTVRQSLILIEEADILFDEDKGFWSAVIELVAESKRPVVIVCNDLELVPVHDLPVQQVLSYRLPGLAGESVGWLQTVAAEMGVHLRAEEAEAMLRVLPGTEHGCGLDEEEGADVRQALNQVQFGHFAAEPPLTHAEVQQRDFLESLAAQKADIKAVARAAESSSLADVFESGLRKGSEVDGWGEAGVEASTSRQWGTWVQLVPQPLAWQQQRQALSGSAEVEYRATLTELHARFGVEGMPSIMCEALHGYAGMRMTDPLLECLQRRQASQLHTLVRPLLVHRHTSTHLPPSLIVDYAPLIRLMALVDEDLASIHASLHQESTAQPQSGRSTRNSSRALTSWLTGKQDWGYERYLAALGPEEVEVAKRTSLVF